MRSLFILAVAGGIPARLSAQNLLVNPGFTSDLTGWQASNEAGKYSVTWSGVDAAGSASSGSAVVTNVYGPAGVATDALIQCVPVTPGATYEVSVDALLPAGQGRTGHAFSLLYWYPTLNCGGAPIGPGVGFFQITSVGPWVHAIGPGALLAPADAATAGVRFGVFKQEGGGSLRAHFDNASFELAGTYLCVPSATVLCLDDGPGDRRFQVDIVYSTTQSGGLSGDARAVPLASLGVLRGGLFWFFNSANPELLVKVLNGCALNNRYWVFYSAGTNVGFTLTVTDTFTGRVFRSSNPDLMPAAPVQNTGALSCS